MTPREFAEMLLRQRPALLDAKVWFIDVHPMGEDCVEVRHDEGGSVFVTEGIGACGCARCAAPRAGR